MSQYLNAALEALESSASGVPLKVAALKAVRKYVHSSHHPEFYRASSILY
jgi:hypothetical protein